jgi:hypothetical protein
MTTDLITPDLRATLRRLKLGRLLDTLPDRLVLARQQQMPHQDFLLLLLNDEISSSSSHRRTDQQTPWLGDADGLVLPPNVFLVDRRRLPLR